MGCSYKTWIQNTLHTWPKKAFSTRCYNLACNCLKRLIYFSLFFFFFFCDHSTCKLQLQHFFHLEVVTISCIMCAFLLSVEILMQYNSYNSIPTISLHIGYPDRTLSKYIQDFKALDFVNYIRLHSQPVPHSYLSLMVLYLQGNSSKLVTKRQ